MSYRPEELKQFVLRLRTKLGLENVRRLNMFIVLDRMKEAFPDFGYERVDRSELPLGEGLYDSAASKIKIPASVFEGLDHDARARFTVAHEIGHWVLAHDGQRYRHAQRKAYERAVSQIRRDERQADQFAALFLAPDHLVESCRTIAEIQREFGLSQQAAEIRKQEVDASIRMRTGRIRELPGNVVDFLQRARAKGHNVTSLPVEPVNPLPKMPGTSSVSSSVSQTHYIDERCTNCGRRTLVPFGSKYRCDTCKFVSDGFQDGDVVA